MFIFYIRVGFIVIIQMGITLSICFVLYQKFGFLIALGALVPLAIVMGWLVQYFLEFIWPSGDLYEKTQVMNDIKTHLAEKNGAKMVYPSVGVKDDEIRVYSRRHQVDKVDNVVLDALKRWNYEVEHSEIVAGWHYYSILPADTWYSPPVVDQPSFPSFPIAFNRRGRLIFADVTEPHLLLGGSSGKGKSTLIRSMFTNMRSLYGDSFEVFGWDGKAGLELDGIADMAFKTVEEWVAWMDTVQSDMDRRLEVLRSHNKRGWAELPPEIWTGENKWRIFVIDECADAFDTLISYYITKGEKKGEAERKAYAVVAALLRKGRAVGYRVILATQRTDADVIPGELRAQLGARVILGVPDATSARVIMGQAAPEDYDKIIKAPPGECLVSAPGKYGTDGEWVKCRVYKDFQV